MTKEKSTLIQAGTVVLNQGVSRQDVLIRGDTIAAVGDLSDIKADCMIDASGLLVLPGGVDTHVHFNDEFMGTVSVHDFYTGTLAAAYGGTTSVIDFSNQWPGGTLKDALDKKRDEAAGQALVDWGVHPVTGEVFQNHAYGCNVVFVDGHVQWLKQLDEELGHPLSRRHVQKFIVP